MMFHIDHNALKYMVNKLDLTGRMALGDVCVQNSRVSVSFFSSLLIRRKLVTLSSCDRM